MLPTQSVKLGTAAAAEQGGHVLPPPQPAQCGAREICARNPASWQPLQCAAHAMHAGAVCRFHLWFPSVLTLDNPRPIHGHVTGNFPITFLLQPFALS